ncbi:hypothetical protein [Kriegella aquimaris]|uniref:Uncharacterized protein n=1 Tax=Kriegella aquimaris TaxID=192904 RepID=A0A1G9QWT2_9FLAO|nr:hypothetical protein [Kriegella aquimaris]SDM15468.1 hypothetical protein SAMN04488514_105248 [Kriegella aquimaris]
MKYVVLLVVLASLSAIVYGFTIQEENVVLADKCIGFGTVGLFLLAMPLFLLSVSKGKKMKDYMLTEENILKMQSKTKEKSKKQ